MASGAGACGCVDGEGGAAGAPSDDTAAGALSGGTTARAVFLLPVWSETKSGLLSAASVTAVDDAAVGDRDSDGDAAGAREIWRGA